MKYIIIFFVSVILSGHCMAQTRALVEYKEGPGRLGRLFANAYGNGLTKAYDPEIDTNFQYFSVLFSVGSSGKIGDRIIVTAVGGASKMPALLIDAIRKTDGMWINHVGRTVWVEQSFLHRYMDPNKPQPLLPSRMDVYDNWNRGHPDDSFDYSRFRVKLSCPFMIMGRSRINLKNDKTA